MPETQSDKSYLFRLTNMMENIFIFKRFSPLKTSVKLILSIRGKRAISICQSSHLLEGSAHRLRNSVFLVKSNSVWGNWQKKPRGKCFCAAVEESTRSTMKMMLFQGNLCGSDVSKTYLTVKGSWLTVRDCLCWDTNCSQSLECKLKFHHIKQMEMFFQQGEKKITSSGRGPPW